MKAILLSETEVYEFDENLANTISGMEIELPCSPSKGMLIGIDIDKVQQVGLKKSLATLKFNYLVVTAIIVDDGVLKLRVKPDLKKID